MKYTLRFLLLALASMFCITTRMQANPVNEQQARTVAQNFLRSVSNVQVERLTNITDQTSWHEFYIFSFESNTTQSGEKGAGFVIVSADDCVIPILGYSLSNRFETSNIPSGLRDWLQSYEEQIAWCRKQMSGNDGRGFFSAFDPNAPLQDWNRLMSEATTTTDLTTVGPLLTTHWNQNDYYNNSCPVATAGPNGHVWAGPDATAAAQIMKKWNHPSTGYGSHSYTHATYGSLNANFGNTTYDWNNMPDSLTSANSAMEVDAVAVLMYHIGVAVEVNYGATGSGAQLVQDFTLTNPCVENALRNYFKYKSTLHQIVYADYSDSEWKNLLIEDLNAGRPILYRGADSLGYYHTFVCDGYNASTSLFHFNWGNSGSADGDYAIGSLNPTATKHYNTANIAVIGIEPNNDWGETTTVTATANNSSFGSVTGGGTYALGESVTLTAQAASGMRFDGWSDGYKYNPRHFTAGGGDLHFTARFRSIAADTLSYCSGNNCYVGLGASNGTSTNYWGVKYPIVSQTSGRKLVAVQLFVRSAGTYTVKVYSGSPSIYSPYTTQTFTVNATEVNSWKTVALNSPFTINKSRDLYITFTSAADHPAAGSYYAGNADAQLWGSNYNTLNSNNKYSWMIKAITTADDCDTISTFPYTETFESSCCWNFVNGNNSNRWCVGTATNNTDGGIRSMYVSNNNGTDNTYSLDSETPGVIAYKTFLLEARNYSISYSWKAHGVTDSDYLRVALVPATTDPTALIPWGNGNLPAGSFLLDGNSQLTLSIPFTNRTDTVSISTTGYYNLVFYWTNSGHGNGTNTAASIDNISIGVICPPIATIPFHEDFETDNGCWHFINGNYVNQWVISAHSGSDHYLYISNNGGANNNYTNTSTSMVKAYRTLQLEARKYSITYEYRANGEVNYDYMRIALAPESIDQTSNMNWGYDALPADHIPLDGNKQISQHNSASTATIVFSVPSDGLYNLVFYWRNDNLYGSQYPAAVDNIFIDTLEEVACDPATLVYYTDFETQGNDSEWTFLNGNYSNQWAIGSATNNTDSGNRALYVSYDLGASNAYTTAEAAMVMAYHTLQLEARQYAISYDWKAYGEPGNDYLRVALVPTSVSLSAGDVWSSGSLPSTSYKPADGGSQLTGHSGWTTQYANVTVPAEGDYNLVFYWRNNNSSGTPPPAAIDNISVGYPDVIHIGDTLSYCGNAAYSNHIGYSNNPVWWGINLTPSQLANSDYLQSVMLYTYAAGSYTLNIYSGDCNNPSTLIYSRSYNIESSTQGYRTLLLDSALLIDHTQHLWVTFYNQGVDYPLTYCNYVGTPQSNWISEDGNIWYPINTLHSNFQCSWLIKCITVSETDVCNDVVDAFPYIEDFEDPSTHKCWTLINDFPNKWAIGTATNNTPDGSNALYISNDGGISNAYTYLHAPSVAMAYRTVQLDASDYTISFDWKLFGTSYYSQAFMRVILVPESFNISGTSWDYDGPFAGDFPVGSVLVDGQYPLHQSSSWTTHTTNISIPVAGRYKLVFYWKNESSNSNYNPPAAIDNISINPTYPTIDTALTAPFIMDFEDNDQNEFVRFRNGNYATKWVVGTAANNTVNGSHALYISGDGGITNTVGLHATASVIAYLPIELENREYTIRFDWKGEGWENDMIRVALVRDTISLTNEATVWNEDVLPVDYNSLSSTNLIGHTDWSTLSTEFLVPTTGRYKLVFYWYNQYYYHTNGYLAAAIDNIVVDTVPSNIISFCGENAFMTNLHFTNSDFSWGIRFTPQQMSRHNFLQGVLLYTDEYVFSEGSDDVTLNIYSGSDSEPETLLYSHVYTIEDVEGYKYLRLDSNMVIDHTQHLWITFHRDHSSYIPCCRGWKYNNNNWVGYNDYWQPIGDYSWMIKAVVRSTELVQEGDTISYCGSDSYQSTVGMGSTSADVYWGIRIPAEHLTGRNSIEEVLLYVKQAGVYTLSIHQGNQTTPQTLLFSQTYSFTSMLNQYRSCTLPYPINIDTTQDLWVTFHNIGISYPAAGCEYIGSIRSDLVSTDGVTWNHAFSDYNLAYTWMIKVVTSGLESNCGVVASFPYTMDFETDDSSCWRFVNGNCTNQWAIGTATDNSASGSGHALYISNNGGASNFYDISTASTALVYRTLQLEARDYIVSFDWKANGETDYDYLRAALIPASVALSTNDTWGYASLPTGYIPLDNNAQLGGQSMWNTRSVNVSISSPGFYNLVFFWHNNNNTGSNPPAAIDNILIDTVWGCDVVTTYDTLVLGYCHLPYQWNGNEINGAGDYSATLMTSLGCDSIVMLHLTVIYSNTGDTTAVACDSFEWYGVTLTETGDYTHTLTNVMDCDSVVTLHLTIIVGINDHDFASSMTIYPNPTNGMVNVQCTMNTIQAGTVEFHVFDAFGRFLRSTNANGSSAQTQIDLSHFASGVYLIKAVADGNVVAVRKVIKN